MALDERLLKILACPKCKGDLEYKGDKDVLICHSCSLVYLIEEDIPIMLIDEAIPLDQWQDSQKKDKND